MASESDGEQPHEGHAARRAAQDSAGELARMGIDPRALGLEPSAPPTVPPAPVDPAGPAIPAQATATPPVVRGVASLPSMRAAEPVRTAEPVRAVEPVRTVEPAGASTPVAADKPARAPVGTGRGPTTYGRARPTPVPTPPPVPPPTGHPPSSGPPPWLDSTLSRPIGVVARPAAPADYLPALARIVAPPSLGAGASWRRLLRAVTLGLIEPGAAAAVEYERRLVARAQLRRPEPRVVAFVAGKGGVGTSTTAAGVALTLATLRGDTTALVSARNGAGSLGERLRGQPAPPVPALVSGAPPAEPLWVHANLAVVDGSPWHTPTPREPLLELLDQLRSRHPLTVVDVGNELAESAQGAIERADQVVLVASASQDAIAAVRVGLSRIHQVDPFRLSTVVIALVCLNARQYRRTLRLLRTELGVRGPRIVPVGFDPWLAAGHRIEPARLRPAVREAYLQLAGLIVEPGEQEQWFAQPSGQQPSPEAAGPAGGYR